jgi:hypothetical protein
MEKPKYEIVTVDLAPVVRVSMIDDVFERAFKRGYGLAKTLKTLEARGGKRRVALILRNIDGCSGMDDESAIVGALRTELQRVNNVAVFYTLSDRGFLDRNFANPKASFFKQAVILETPDLPEKAVDEWAYALTSQIIEDNVRGEIITNVGLKASDLARFFERLRTLRLLKGGSVTAAVPLTEVQEALKSLADEQASHYASWLPMVLSPRQRAVMIAFAYGVPLRATDHMSRASGVPVSALTGIIANLEKAGHVLVERERPVMADPFLRLHLVTR